FVHLHLCSVFIHFLNAIHIGEINFRIHSLSVEVHPKGHQVDVAGALTVTEQAPFDTVGTRHVSQLCSSNAASSVIMRVQGKNNRVPVFDIAVHPLDLVCVPIRCGHLDGGGQVEDHLTVGRGFQDFGNPV